MTGQGRHSFLGPPISAPGSQSVPIQDACDHLARANMGKGFDGADDFGRRMGGVLTASPACKAHLGMDAAFPMNHTDGFTRLCIHIDHDFLNQTTHDTLLQSGIRIRMVPYRFQSRCKIRMILQCRRRRAALGMIVLTNT